MELTQNKPSEEFKALLARYEVFLNQHIYPIELKAIYGSFKAALPELQALREKAKDEGLFAPHLSKEEGGLGLSLQEFGRISEILGKSPIGHYVFNCQAPDIGNMELMHQFASKELKEKYLKPLQKGEIRSCFAMTEPDNPGSNPVHLSTTAIKEGDHYIINGHKWFTSSADGAHFTIVMAVTDPENPNPYQRASMILVPLDNPGFQLVRNIPIMGDVGEDYMSHGEVKFINCRVPVSNLIGDEGQGFALAQERLGPGRIHHCMRWIGICERAIELMCKRALSRMLDPGKPLANQQTIQNWIAESVASVKASRLMVLATAQKIDEDGAKAAKEDISTIKFFVSDVLMTTLDRAIQVHGALGITDDTLLSFWYRHERGARIYDGPDEVHKTVLAKRILKQFASP
ncbi:acyl-CoA dehydrogenase family protein [Cecembia calidifontis]|jgi:alkylation response protein AidB-like acyl-CoA dehydrogenase|uniref:Alkylation response protein AidB-like acyl-CoA dehydrogenase n=1 Tax=Cecembia calidifontis TaxID=1187080 RepID=A0A4Q7PAU0_9BACT|nr:acyl-CoA dehydrogenase family protein [Cecembia calidifontis]RZS97393.1 alkylation response protein AidB-like acyl-CoA dehydrogenase [Cecembia calidifontis]